MLKTEEENIRLFNEEVTLLKVKLAGLLEKEKAYQNELIDYYKNEREIKELLKSKFQELTDLDEQKKELQAKIKQNNMLLEQALSKISLLKNKQSLKASDLNNLKDKIERLSKEQKAYAKKLNELKEELHEKKVLFARLETEKKNEEVRLEEKFGLTYDDIKVTVEDSSEILDRIKNLKKQIAKLGDVNLAAIEEFKRKKERHDFLKKQEEDLSEAKSVLNKVILEVDQVMIKRFTEAFKEVNSAFGDIYQRLFGGGIAQLKLTDPNDLLETGVDIEVQPPGKKLQNLTLLSGGERALTVIALLFALLSCKPSPFCVLDEIEASLDETNVERFASFLKLFTQKTQFVVISHRQGTIEVADALYGVTMEESGVSKIISVKLTEGEGQESRSA
jgi:chromosome segregation protein